MTTLFLDNGVASVKWRDSKNIVHSCTEESYTKIFKQAMKETKFARDHDKEERVDKLQNREKKVDEIANSNEDIIKQKEDQLRKLQDEDRSALMRMSNQDLLDEIERLKKEKDTIEAEIHDIEDKKSKSASRDEFICVDNYQPTYSVIRLSDRKKDEGEQLMIELGSK